MINDLKTQVKLFPAIGLFAPKGNLKELKEEIAFRSGFLKNQQLKSLKYISEPDDLIHIKFFFNSPEIRDKVFFEPKYTQAKRKQKLCQSMLIEKSGDAINVTRIAIHQLIAGQ